MSAVNGLTHLHSSPLSISAFLCYLLYPLDRLSLTTQEGAVLRYPATYLLLGRLRKIIGQSYELLDEFGIHHSVIRVNASLLLFRIEMKNSKAAFRPPREFTRMPLRNGIKHIALERM